MTRTSAANSGTTAGRRTTRHPDDISTELRRDILAGVFQGETCIATADCTIALTDADGAVAIGEAQRELIDQYLFRG